MRSWDVVPVALNQHEHQDQRKALGEGSTHAGCPGREDMHIMISGQHPPSPLHPSHVNVDVELKLVQGLCSCVRRAECDECDGRG